MPILPLPALNALVTKAAKKVKTTAPLVAYKRHALHYVLKGIGNLPTPLLDRLNHYLKAPSAEQYPHTDAHLRLILAYNNKLKRPLHITHLLDLRRKFATDAIGLQAPEVWQQTSDNKNTDTVKLTANEAAPTISWQDKVIANADGGDMTIRCYQSGSNNTQKSDQNYTKKHQPNPDIVSST